MKKISLALSMAAALIFSASVNAQDSRNPWGISVGAHAVDYTSVRSFGSGIYDVDDMTVVPPLSKLSIVRNLGSKFNVDLTASVGEVDNKRMNINDELFINAGLGLRYQILGKADKSFWFDPYLRLGASYNKFDFSGVSISESNPYTVAQATGYDDNDSTSDKLYQTFEGEEAYFMAQAGFGLNLWLTDNFGVNLATDYNFAPSEDTDYVNFFQHTAGVTFKFGMQDQDGDGIPDEEDECPEVAGVEQFNGCPDTDGDGIRDLDDACPEIAGVAEFNGCVDTDGDGIADPQDDCPAEAGPAENNGCPWGDADSDGLTDNVDKCPTEAGPKENGGCPWGDADGDGFTDNVDKCPNEAGVAPDGCPKPEAAALVQDINVGFKVEFETNKAAITAVSQQRLVEKADQIKEALKVYPNLKLYVDGYTDSKGSASYNQRLSLKRAQAVDAALEANGIATDVMDARGFGEENPKCTNETEEGRQCNRRVVVTIKSK